MSKLQLNFRNVLRVLWASAGVLFIYFDVYIFGNKGLSPSFWLILGILALFGAVLGLSGGVGFALLAQGLLKFKQMLIITGGMPALSADFSIFDRIAHIFFIIYGIFLIVLRVKKISEQLGNKKICN